MFLEIQKSTNFYNEFYIHLLCEFFVVSDYDEMNLVYGVFFKMSYEVHIVVICNEHEFDVRMNGNVKFVET
jgi:hypothetical protein